MAPISFIALLFAVSVTALAPAGPWDAFNFAPSTRSVAPKSVRSTVGQVTGAENLIGNTRPTKGATIAGNGSHVVLDFGQEVGGRLSFQVNSATSSSAVSLSFTESPLFISPTTSDDSCFTSFLEDSDGVLSLPPLTSNETFTQTVGDQRGGFRFLTIVSNGEEPVTISNVALNVTFMPQLEDLSAYTGYFFATDTTGFHDPEFLTKLWYGGAYTVQMNTIDSHQARQQPCPVGGGWANNATGGPVEGTILVDGAKRDSLHLRPPILTKLFVGHVFDAKPTTGALQYSGPPINAMGSDTYICWSLIGTHSVYLYTGDLNFVEQVWANYTFALSFLQSQVDETGLMNVPVSFSNDWGRVDGQGHNSAANALLYQTLITASELATTLGHTSLAAEYVTNASSIKEAYNKLLWNETAGMFMDNDMLNDTIIPFVGGFELQAHFIAGQGERALDLLHREWGYMLYTNISVQSTMLEGFTANGSLGLVQSCQQYRSAAGYDFDHTYTSHAHGWATGPTFSLTFYLVGLMVTSPQGATWSVAPVLSGLTAAQGGFETGLGWFGANWTLTDNTTFTLAIDTPSGTNGTVTLPGAGDVSIDGSAKDVKGTKLSVPGGSHVIVLHMQK
ncbi:glycoside hydrolase family 78 protein [Rhodocollybia butyracea]|uniref:Glycoside hydrolase family 78 protein n=1 Tax=Rhodocollybia butyracea TaxID=206335 RepID=A0A9P5PVU1_9AGAR|nr:glycoside hydrolase family 78 protein [Rhodocollybia butyracea]